MICSGSSLSITSSACALRRPSPDPAEQGPRVVEAGLIRVVLEGDEDLRGMVDGLSDRMLSVRLRELEQAGLVARAVEPTVPVTVQYGLTPRGAELLTAIQPLPRYAQRWEAGPEESAASA